MKVYDFKIPKKPGENIVLQHDKGSTFFDKLHQHPEIQISQIVNGQGKLIVGDSVHSYMSGDFFVIGSGLPHLFKSAQSGLESHMVSLFFTTDSFFGDSFFENREMRVLDRFFDHTASGFKLSKKNETVLKDMLEIGSKDHFSRFIAFLVLLKKVGQLQKTQLSGFVHPKEISDGQGERLRSVFDFVMKNFSEKITLDTVSKLAHMTPNAFCRFFRQRTNKTFFKFLIEVRIEHACQLLLHNEGLAIADVAERSGFNSISNFNRKFREIKGVNPSKFIRLGE